MKQQQQFISGVSRCKYSRSHFVNKVVPCSSTGQYRFHWSTPYPGRIYL